MSASAVTPTILVVDDDEGLLLLIKDALRAEKWNVAAASSGNDALRWLQENSADLLLLDLKLRDIETRDFIGTLPEKGRPVPFVIITGQGDERVAVEMMKRGALDYLVKDINFIEFLPTVVSRAFARMADERKLAQAQEAAIESRSLTQAVLNSLTAQIAVLDQQGNILAVNEPWKSFSRDNGGYSPGRTSVGANYLQICRRAAANSEQNAAEIVAGIQAVMDRASTHCSVEYPYHSPGMERWFVMTVTPLAKDSGGVVVSHTDITRRKQAELASRESEERYRELVQVLPAAVYTCDAQGRIALYNAAAAALWGRKPKIGSQRWCGSYRLFTPDGKRLPLARCPMAMAMSKGKPSRDTELIVERPDGSRSHILTFPNPTLDHSGAVTGAVNMLVDITALKKTEQALVEQTSRYRSLVEVSPDAIFVLKHGRIEFINPEGMRLFGAGSAGEVMGKSPFDFFRPSRHEFIQEQVDRLLQTSSASPLIDEELVRLDGSIRWVTLSAAMFTESGETAVQFILRDITEQKRLENEILEISEREQRKFGHDLHDGLGQRLTGLEMFSHGLAEDLKHHAPALAKQARRLNRELRETVTQARLISHSLAPVPLEGDGLMRGLTELAASTSRIPGVACRFTCDPPICIGEVTTATHLYRIAQEAVNNAVKHGRAKAVEITLTENSDGVELSVENNGRPMLQARNADSGVGLNVMRYRAEVIGASLSIKPGKRKGVRVTCSLRRKT